MAARTNLHGRGLRLLVGLLILVAPPALAQQSGTITLIGTVARNCTVSVTATGSAVNLDLGTGNKRIEIGNVVQNCNRRAGYYLHVLSANCATPPAGAKLVGSVDAETLGYSVEFNNPTTGGSQATVTGLLANACSGAAAIEGREVTNARVSGETSRIYVNYSGNNGLAADSYSDTLTITMVVK